MSAHTPGPWQWFTHSGGAPYLATPDRGRLYVMSFARLGMQGATVRFSRWDGMRDGVKRLRMGGIMEDGLLLADGSLHPDARLIEAAPDLLDVAQRFLEHLQCGAVETHPDDDISDAVRAAIAKATGAKP